ncbi:hypothetical protein HanRHA438_Chr02g0092141 [Helianthus annuus]|nr:hypothetical protein HanRHA438_Chr02g0092141 [Helianthus annuus]
MFFPLNFTVFNKNISLHFVSSPYKFKFVFVYVYVLHHITWRYKFTFLFYDFYWSWSLFAYLLLNMFLRPPHLQRGG